MQQNQCVFQSIDLEQTINIFYNYGPEEVLVTELPQTLVNIYDYDNFNAFSLRLHKIPT